MRVGIVLKVMTSMEDVYLLGRIRVRSFFSPTRQYQQLEQLVKQHGPQAGCVISQQTSSLSHLISSHLVSFHVIRMRVVGSIQLPVTSPSVGMVHTT